MSEESFEALDFPPEFQKIYDLDQTGQKIFKLFVNGEWRNSTSGRFFDVRSPSTRSIIGKVSQGTKEDALEAISAAQASQPAIRLWAAIERIELLEKASKIIERNSEFLKKLMMIEAGKTEQMANGEIVGASDRLKLTLEEAKRIYGEYIPGDWVHDTRDKFAIVLRQPVGVVAAITPFNYPLFSPVAKIAPALVSGNSIVLKPASDTPIIALALVRILETCGLPKGSINVVPGPGGEVGDTLVSDERVNAVSFTGSTDVGSRIPFKAGMKRLHLELGGKAAAIVLADADLNLASEKMTLGVIKNSGQRCDSISRALVVNEIARQLVEMLTERFSRVKFGNPWEEVSVGPLINERALNKVSELVDDAINKGAKLLVGGNSHELIYEPTLLDEVPLDARIAWEEIFGPVLPIIRVKDTEEAIEISNRSHLGLDSAVFTNNIYNMWSIAKSLQVGTVSINDAPTHGVGNFPFGGLKQSGIGREGLGYSIDELTVLKTISVNLEPTGRRGLIFPKK